MAVEDDTREPPPTQEDAERACDELRDQLERARKVVERYRNVLSDAPKPPKDGCK